MSWWVWALIAWLALSPPIAILLGRAIRLSEKRDAQRSIRDRRESLPAEDLPEPREPPDQRSA